MDFNVDPMTASFHHIVEENGEDVVIQFDEAYLNNSSTFEMVEWIEDRFDLERHSRLKRRINIYPDATGKARESNASKTDIAILRQAGFKVHARSSNPRVKDRVNCVNNMFKTLSGKVKYKVNATNCPKTVNDYHKVESTKDGRLDKDQEKVGLKHMSDNVGYMEYYKFPLMGKNRTVKK
jgi:hypothetical protein